MSMGYRAPHQCPASSCTRTVPYERLACPEHWFRVSITTRRAVTRAWNSGDQQQHTEAMIQAIQEMNAPPVGSSRHDPRLF